MSTQTKERPILFSGEMVRAILSGKKTQTRRMVPQWQIPKETSGDDIEDMKWMSVAHNHPRWGFGVFGKTEDECMDHYNTDHKNCHCPYGKRGDLLWAKETWTTSPGLDDVKPREISKNQSIGYIADDEGPWLGKKRPSIFMMRWMSRIQLEITDIRVERLNDISEADAKDEGVRLVADDRPPLPLTVWSYKAGFEKLWESINGQGSWDLSPWVWVVEFKVTESGRCG